MATVKFLTTTKYHGSFFPPHENVEVDDADIDEMVKIGAIIVSKDDKSTGEKTSSVDDSEDTSEKKSESTKTKAPTKNTKTTEKKSK